jgi:DNA-binding winged helix-turn-helix (wHTH) protein
MSDALAVIPAPMPTPMLYGRGDYYTEVTRLRGELDEAHETIAQLRALLAPPEMAFPSLWKLTPKESDLLRVLMATPEITKEHLITALYDQDPDVEIKVIDVLVCKLRRKVLADDVKIETVRGRGYRIAPEVKAAIRDMIRNEEHEAAPQSAPFVPSPSSRGPLVPLADIGVRCRAIRTELELSEDDARRVAGLKYAGLVFLIEAGKGERRDAERLLRSLKIERDRIAQVCTLLG